MNRIDTGAVFSPCRRYRYRLWRRWDKSIPHATFLMMNPSTADEVNDDPTVARCAYRVVRPEWRDGNMPCVGGVEVVNVFAWRETDSKMLPARITENIDIVGPDNDSAIVEACKSAAIVVCAWGKPGHFLLDRGRLVLRLLRDNGITPHVFKVNADGSPKHPLYVSYSTIPFEWSLYK